MTTEVKSRIEFELAEEIRLGVRFKQRWRARTLFNKLTCEGVYSGSERRFQEVFKEIRTALGTQPVKSHLPLDFKLGEALQVDHGEADVIVGGQRCTVYLFIACIPGHGRKFAQAYPIKAMESWGEFHNEAFEFYGGVFPKVFYDNDSVLVKEVLGRERAQTDFALYLQEHFGFEAVFCNPAAGWEKGAVENAVGYMRRNYLPGIKSFESFEELNAYLLSCSSKEMQKEIKRNNISLKDILIPLPDPKAWEKHLSLRVNSYQLLTYKGHSYSVPERYVGQYLQARVSVFKFNIYCGGDLVATHLRCFKDQEHSLQLDHYLDPLLKKPAGLTHCQATKNYAFSEETQDLWSRLLNKHDSTEANREFIKALLLRRKCTPEQWQTAVALALAYGSIESDAIANILHQLQTPTQTEPTAWINEKLPHLPDVSCTFDLMTYADLCQGDCHAQ